MLNAKLIQNKYRNSYIERKVMKLKKQSAVSNSVLVCRARLCIVMLCVYRSGGQLKVAAVIAVSDGREG